MTKKSSSETCQDTDKTPTLRQLGLDDSDDPAPAGYAEMCAADLAVEKAVCVLRRSSRNAHLMQTTGLELYALGLGLRAVMALERIADRLDAAALTPAQQQP